ncbi:MAG: hypothetical protein ACLTAS_07395 [Butyribacter sp.]
MTTNRVMIACCCNDGTRPVIFKIERIDIGGNKSGVDRAL